jgi:hypothetical protein
MIKSKFWKDILRDKNSVKYSITKFSALVALTLLVIHVLIGIVIMIINSEIDHVIAMELIGLILTLNGFKNKFGIRNKFGDNNISTKDVATTTTTTTTTIKPDDTNDDLLTIPSDSEMFKKDEVG